MRRAPVFASRPEPDAKRYTNATTVVLMRDGTRTVFSMQNNAEPRATTRERIESAMLAQLVISS
jgi:hypothetical protein